jgi:hypothetical protein
MLYFVTQTGQTHQGPVEYHLLMPCRLPDRYLAPRTYSYELAMRTFHYYLHIIDKAIDNVKGLRNSRLRLLESKSVKP